MTLTKNWEKYWNRVEEPEAGNPVFFSKSSNDIIFDNLPDGRKDCLNLNGGAICISNTKSLLWMPLDEEWVEL